ncbi:hypothetical protein ACLQ3K_24850 [Tsukamurella sp. DT100]|uniref:hypothetical protein n=1 Tax=Tsukamurella sp. DT100 TaxID=3393415 RepID=UPI003CEA467A
MTAVQNPRFPRIATAEIRDAALATVREMLQDASMTRWAACVEVSRHIPYAASTVQKWCVEAEIGRDAESDRVRELEAKLKVARLINKHTTGAEADF